MALRTMSIIAVLALAACNMADRPPREREARANVAENASEPAPTPWGQSSQSGNSTASSLADNAQLAVAPPSAPGGVSRDWFAGSWTDDGDCSDAARFNPDGQYVLADGTRGMWNVRGGRLVVQNAEGRNEVQIRRVGDDVVEIVNDDGSVGRSTRC